MKEQQLTAQFYPRAEIENRVLPELSAQERAVDSSLLHSSSSRLGQSSRQPSHKILRRQEGQIVVEYVLMLLVAIAIAVVLINFVVSRDESNPGFLMQAWNGIIETISSDATDEVTPAKPPAQGP